MAYSDYSDKELDQYFSNPEFRHGGPNFSAKSSPVKTAVKTTLVLGGLMLIGVLSIVTWMWILSDDLPPFEKLENPDVSLATVAYTADGKELARYYLQNRNSVTLDEMSPMITRGLVATEDHRFYEHWGMDLFRTASAVTRTIFGDKQGGSTITQQLARNMYVEIGTASTVSRKLKEMITAVQLERNYTKDEILAMYLNTVAFGRNAFGIEAASRTFFDKSVIDLDTTESALLIGVLKGTTYYDPVRRPERALGRRNTVLGQMMKREILTQAQYDSLSARPLGLRYNPSSHTANLAPYFAEHLRLWLRRWGRDNQYNIYRDGLTVYTTLDSRLQAHAEAAVDSQLTKLQNIVDYEWTKGDSAGIASTNENDYADLVQEEGFVPFSQYWQSRRHHVDNFVRETSKYVNAVNAGANGNELLAELHRDQAFMDSLRDAKTTLQGSVVSIDPRNGHVKAWVGGRDFVEDKYDHISIAKRQPGSTFKPFVYTAAIDNGYSPYYRLLDSPIEIEDASDTSKTWRPTDINESSNTFLTLREGLSRSINVITARLVQLVGARNVVEYAHQMGIKSGLLAVPSIALGTSPVTLEEMVSAYGTLANNGLHNEPVYITRIEDKYGNVVADFRPVPREALSAETAYTVVDMMRGGINDLGGTGQRIKWKFNITGYDLASKTGTTQNSADCWFMLIHPTLVTGSWVGFNDQRLHFRTTYWGQGAHSALHVVGDYYQNMLADTTYNFQNISFTVPEGYAAPVPPENDVEVIQTNDRNSHENGTTGW